MTTKMLTAKIEATDGLDCEMITGELAEAACNVANSYEGSSIAIADQDGDNTFLARALEAEGHVRALLDHADTTRGAGIDPPEPACASEARRFLAGRAPQHALAKLLIRCHEAISDQWDEDHEDTIALLDEIDETLRSLPTPEGTDPT